MNVKFLQSQCKNKVVLFVLFVIVTVFIASIMYFTKSEEERKKECNQDILVKTALPASFISLVIVIGLYAIDFPKKENVLLQEDFWE